VKQRMAILAYSAVLMANGIVTMIGPEWSLPSLRLRGWATMGLSAVMVVALSMQWRRQKTQPADPTPNG
jgi:hypothetical protein